MTEIVCVHASVRACLCQSLSVPDSILYYQDQDAKSSYTVMIDTVYSYLTLLCYYYVYS